MKAGGWQRLGGRAAARSACGIRLTGRPLDRRKPIHSATHRKPWEYQHPAIGHFALDVAEDLPHFAAHSTDIEVLREPTQFYQTLLVRSRLSKFEGS